MKNTENTTTKKKKKKKSAGSIFLDLILLIAVCVMVFAGYNLYKIFSEYRAGEKEYEGLQQYVQVLRPAGEDSDSDSDTDADKQSGGQVEPVIDPETGEPIIPEEVLTPPISVNFDELTAINPDIVGWIYVEAIPNICYPIVRGTDNEYYLKHTVERNLNSSASIFMDYQNSADFSDTNTIIYGHNMKNQSMFGLLQNMRDPRVFAKSPYIWILTPKGDYCYQVFSAREVSVTDQVYTLFSAGGEEFKNYLENMQARSEVASELTFTGNEYIITLSTCTSNDATRFVVQAVWKE